MRTFLLMQVIVLFLLALKLLKTSDEREDKPSAKKYSQGLDLKSLPSNVYQLKQRGSYGRTTTRAN